MGETLRELGGWFSSLVVALTVGVALGYEHATCTVTCGSLQTWWAKLTPEAQAAWVSAADLNCTDMAD